MYIKDYTVLNFTLGTLINTFIMHKMHAILYIILWEIFTVKSWMYSTSFIPSIPSILKSSKSFQDYSLFILSIYLYWFIYLKKVKKKYGFQQEIVDGSKITVIFNIVFLLFQPESCSSLTEWVKHLYEIFSGM